MIYRRIMKNLRDLVADQPFLELVVTRALPHFPFLLPHDLDYHGVKYFLRRPDDLILDVGANVGLSALSFRRFGKKFQIISFEPNQGLRPQLEDIQRNDAKFSFEMIGLGDMSSRKTLYVPVVKGIEVHTMASTSKEEVMGVCEKLYSQRTLTKIVIRDLEVQIETLDSKNLNPTFIKIDAEGDEFCILKGGQDTILRTRPVILLEKNSLNFENCQKLFEQWNYKALVYDFHTDTFGDSDLNHRNIYFVPREFSFAKALSK